MKSTLQATLSLEGMGLAQKMGETIALVRTYGRFLNDQDRHVITDRLRGLNDAVNDMTSKPFIEIPP